MQYDVVKTHIENIIPGDTIVHEGELKTVCKKNITFSSFMGRSLFGDCYHSGHKPVKKAINLRG
jgi:hypothetical protein